MTWKNPQKITSYSSQFFSVKDCIHASTVLPKAIMSAVVLLVLLGSIVCHGLASEQDLKRFMPNGRAMAMQVEQAAKGQSGYASYYLEGEKPLRRERALWPFGLDYHDDHDHHHGDHDFHEHHNDDYDFHDHHHDDYDFHDHHHDVHYHDPHLYDAHERHHDQYEHLHEHGYGPGTIDDLPEGAFAGRPMGPSWG